MRLFLSLPVLVVVLSMVLEGPAPAQGTPDVSSALDKLKEFGNTLEDKARELISRIKQNELSAKMREWFSETFQKVKEKLKIDS
ncbi:apolipoprotein C-I, basic form isoform X2 [Pan troglodytes]|uniref:apolipoprotein C-I, basic form isoform X2 n=1 Tax=Pan troglodytes TaxID=9598 RepID=UPI0023F2DA55|nr:apolipoprotein C-I, basic form isoform X2 [Pan troglodytes]